MALTKIIRNFCEKIGTNESQGLLDGSKYFRKISSIRGHGLYFQKLYIFDMVTVG